MALGGLLFLASCARRPDFDIARARMEIAAAFGQPPARVSIYDDGRGKTADDWVVDFKIDGFGPFLQARFDGRDARWALRDVRQRSDSDRDASWEPVGVLIGRVRGESAKNAEETMRRAKELAGLVERYAVDHHNRYPSVEAGSLSQLLLSGGYVSTWDLGNDAWGNPFQYHAAPDGQAYIILSPGADGAWDVDLTTYFSNTDRGIESYGGASSDPDRDVVFATGAFVQSYEPGG